MSLSSVPKHHRLRQSTSHTRSTFLVMLTMPLCTLLLLAGCSARAGMRACRMWHGTAACNRASPPRRMFTSAWDNPWTSCRLEDGSTWLYAQAGKPGWGTLHERHDGRGHPCHLAL